MQFYINQRDVKVNSIYTIQMTDDVVCVSVDFKDKRVEYSCMGYNSGEPNVKSFFFRLKDGMEDTEIRITLDDGWKIAQYVSAVDVGKYNATICLVRISTKKPEELPYWQSED